jgi:tRNA nucleotidyltransferase (CCA-adding enzyme)
LLLREPRPEKGFARLAELEVLSQIHPALTFDAWVEDCFVRLRDVLKDPVWALPIDDYMVELTHFGLLTFRMNLEGLEVLERRLHVQRATIETIRQLHALKGDFDRLARAQTPSAVYQVLESYSRPALLMAHVAADNQLIRDLIHRYIHSWVGIKTVTTGQDLKEQGLSPGPVYKELLNELLYARLDGRISTDEEERTYLDQLLDR